MDKSKYVVGTSGYSFADWVGPFYPPGTRQSDMFAHYSGRFQAVELNFTYYAMPAAATMQRFAESSPPGFEFWVKANQEITHKGNLAVAGQFVENLQPLAAAGKLSGVLLQFPQSFHRTLDSRKYLAAAIASLEALPLAVEFRHHSWDHDSVLTGLRQRNVALAVPDVPDIGGLYRPAPAVTSRMGYLRLHSRNAGQWYSGMAERYDYDYSPDELTGLLRDWEPLAQQVDKVYAFFNNCHRAQAAQNAEAFRRILGQIE